MKSIWYEHKEHTSIKINTPKIDEKKAFRKKQGVQNFMGNNIKKLCMCLFTVAFVVTGLNLNPSKGLQFGIEDTFAAGESDSEEEEDRSGATGGGTTSPIQHQAEEQLRSEIETVQREIEELRQYIVVTKAEQEEAKKTRLTDKAVSAWKAMGSANSKLQAFEAQVLEKQARLTELEQQLAAALPPPPPPPPLPGVRTAAAVDTTTTADAPATTTTTTTTTTTPAVPPVPVVEDLVDLETPPGTPLGTPLGTPPGTPLGTPDKTPGPDQLSEVLQAALAAVVNAEADVQNAEDRVTQAAGLVRELEAAAGDDPTDQRKQAALEEAAIAHSEAEQAADIARSKQEALRRELAELRQQAVVSTPLEGVASSGDGDDPGRQPSRSSSPEVPESTTLTAEELQTLTATAATLDATANSLDVLTDATRRTDLGAMNEVLDEHARLDEGELFDPVERTAHHTRGVVARLQQAVAAEQATPGAINRQEYAALRDAAAGATEGVNRASEELMEGYRLLFRRVLAVANQNQAARSRDISQLQQELSSLSDDSGLGELEEAVSVFAPELRTRVQDLRDAASDARDALDNQTSPFIQAVDRLSTILATADPEGPFDRVYSAAVNVSDLESTVRNYHESLGLERLGDNVTDKRQQLEDDIRQSVDASGIADILDNRKRKAEQDLRLVKDNLEKIKRINQENQDHTSHVDTKPVQEAADGVATGTAAQALVDAKEGLEPVHAYESVITSSYMLGNFVPAVAALEGLRLAVEAFEGEVRQVNQEASALRVQAIESLRQNLVTRLDTRVNIPAVRNITDMTGEARRLAALQEQLPEARRVAMADLTEMQELGEQATGWINGLNELRTLVQTSPIEEVFGAVGAVAGVERELGPIVERHSSDAERFTNALAAAKKAITDSSTTTLPALLSNADNSVQAMEAQAAALQELEPGIEVHNRMLPQPEQTDADGWKRAKDDLDTKRQALKQEVDKVKNDLAARDADPSAPVPTSEECAIRLIDLQREFESHLQQSAALEGAAREQTNRAVGCLQTSLARLVDQRETVLANVGNISNVLSGAMQLAAILDADAPAGSGIQDLEVLRNTLDAEVANAHSVDPGVLGQNLTTRAAFEGVDVQQQQAIADNITAAQTLLTTANDIGTATGQNVTAHTRALLEAADVNAAEAIASMQDRVNNARPAAVAFAGEVTHLGRLNAMLPEQSRLSPQEVENIVLHSTTGITVLDTCEAALGAYEDARRSGVTDRNCAVMANLLQNLAASTQDVATRTDEVRQNVMRHSMVIEDAVRNAQDHHQQRAGTLRAQIGQQQQQLQAQIAELQAIIADPATSSHARQSAQGLLTVLNNEEQMLDAADVRLGELEDSLDPQAVQPLSLEETLVAVGSVDDVANTSSTQDSQATLHTTQLANLRAGLDSDGYDEDGYNPDGYDRSGRARPVLALVPAFDPADDFNAAAQTGSMQATQHGLDGAVVQTTQALQNLGIQLRESSLDTGDKEGESKTKSTSSKSTGTTGFVSRLYPQSTRAFNGLLEMPSIAGLSADNTRFSEARPVRLFASVNAGRLDLKKDNMYSAQVGVLVNPVSELRVGVAYTYGKDELKEFTGINIPTAVGYAKFKGETNMASIVSGWNVDKPGIMAQAIGMYGWGNVKTTRNFTHGDTVISAKGSPDTMIYAGSAQVGYNLPLFAIFNMLFDAPDVLKSMQLTPYIEGAIIDTQWDGYTETHSPLPSHISKLTNRVIEGSAGLRHRWRMVDMLELQTWASCVTSHKNLSDLTGRVQHTVDNRYVSKAAGRIWNETEAEIGLSLSIYITEALGTGLNASVRTKNFRSLNNESAGVRLWYDF